MSLEKNMKAEYERRLDKPTKLVMLLDKDERMCCTSGLPVMGDSVKCTGCNKNMSRDDWNDYLMIMKVN